jgi:D-alanine transfer protein
MRRVLALVGGVAMAVGLFLSPAADAAVRALITVDHPEQRSVRVLNYESPGHREDTVGLYKQALAGTPAGVTNLYRMGSAELGVPIEENPNQWLPTNASDFDMYTSGRGYQQSLYHAIELAAVAGQLPDHKVALLVSPQWFIPGGIKAGAFESVFSYSAWRAMLTNKKLSADTRKRLIARAGALMPALCTARARCAATPAGAAKEFVDTPYTAFSNRVNALRETYDGTNWRKGVTYTGAWQPGSGSMANIDWSAQDARAIALGSSRETTNPYGMDDGYYTKRIVPYLAKLKGHEARVTYTTSTEYDDLQLFLDVARDLGVQVMLVSLPINGRWSDYTGLPQRESNGFAANVQRMAQRNHVPLTDLTVNSYVPYYFFDTLHLGWRGWLDVTRACWNFASGA